MCGIAAIINFERNIKQECGRIEHMMDALKHRGPDQEGVVCRDHALIGHVRLAIIDVACGLQPMLKKHRDTEYVQSYNGMLYNYKELRAELQKLGYTFETDSDTEVVLCAYLQWREACLERLNGIFSFIIFDGNTLFAARDQMGVKPLYYVQKADGEWVFSSEIKAFLQEGSIRPILTKEKFTKMIALGPSLIPDETLYKNIKCLLPGTYLTVKGKHHRLVTYYTLQARAHTDDLETTIAKVRHFVQNAVQRQSVSDVAIGSMLSGGLDSSIVVNEASKYIKHLPTFSLEFEGNEQYFVQSAYQSTLDGPFIAQVVQQAHTNHQQKTIDQATVAAYLKRAMQSRDMPAMADIDSSLLWFCEEMVKDVKVVLSGECADEIFGGYPWFYREELIRMNTFPWLQNLPDKIGLLREEYRQLDFYGVRKDAYEKELDRVSYLDSDSVDDKIARKMTYLCKDYFMQTLLMRMDACCSAVGLEGRVPFADVELINYVYNVPWEMKYHNKQEKGLLRAAFDGVLPQAVLQRKKNPFPKTHHPAFTEFVAKELLVRIKTDSVLTYLFSQSKLQELIVSGGASFELPWFGQLMRGPQLLAYLLQFDQWIENYRVKIEF